uniref:Two-component sensor histidine kinase n=1 Tax=Heterorhabditis bacteriophora TaxID=37862 RepID=A0A1I7XIP7_HETBA
MLLDRVRGGTTRLITGVRSPKFRKWTPLLLFLVLIVYMFMGSACFWYFEHDRHEHGIRKWYMNLAVNRRHFARSISSRIFNDTRNLLIIIDREQTERVQQLLVESLKRYEDRLDIRSPDKREWTFLNSFNYAYGLLLTVGHGGKIPETVGGQVQQNNF